MSNCPKKLCFRTPSEQDLDTDPNPDPDRDLGHSRVSERSKYLRLGTPAQGQGPIPLMKSSRTGTKARKAEQKAAESMES